MKPLVRCAVFAATLVAAAAAQQPPPPPPDGPGHGRHHLADPEQRQAFLLDILTSRLNLDAAQAGQIKNIFAQAQAAAGPVRDDIHAAYKNIVDAVKEGKSKAELERLQKQIGSAHAALAAIETKAFTDAYALLKPDQRTNSDALFGMITMLLGPRPGPGGPMGGPPPRFGPPHDQR